MNKLYEKVNYSANVPFIFGSGIYEYDIQKANINILLHEGIISKEYYDKLYNSYKLQREIAIGNLQRRDKKITEIIQNGIIQAKKELFELNYITPSEVLSIKNDAIFIIGRILNTLDVLKGDIHFIEKNKYTSFVRLPGIEVYYGFNRVNDTENYSIKGLGKAEPLHKDYMTDFILFILGSLQIATVGNCITYIKEFYNQYINRNLPIGYYREYNAQSYYIIGEFAMEDIPDTVDNKKNINISYNANILKILMQYVSSVYMMS